MLDQQQYDEAKGNLAKYLNFYNGMLDQFLGFSSEVGVDHDHAAFLESISESFFSEVCEWKQTIEDFEGQEERNHIRSESM